MAKPAKCVVCGGGPVWPTWGMCGVCVNGSAEFVGTTEPPGIEVRADGDEPATDLEPTETEGGA